MANNTSTFQGDEFSNNLFSDLGPLLALFGERVATQYLRHSTRKLESLIFACAPLGILTAITSAIRVGGDRKLKAMIGRAEEPDAVAEIELISSTSVDVCELWNGVGLVRVVGKPHILELVIDDDLLSGYGNHQTGSGDSRESSSVKVYGLYTRKGMNALWPDPKCVDKFNPESIAPGISLNTIGSFTSNWEVYAAAVFGVILQLAVLAGDAIITYKYRLEKGGRAVATYAFPLTCIGTLGLVFGMYLCASIIEVSTQELEWLPISAAENNFGTRQYRILWVQKGQTVGDQRFASYAIYAPSQHHTLMTSHRRVGATLHRRTIAAMTVSFGAFILQFVGLRAMHYSASIAQLIATIIMTAIRVAIRRHISQEPQRYTYATENEVQPVPPDSQLSEEIELTSISGPQHQSQHPVRYTVQELKDGHELDIIAKQLQNCKLWQIVSFWEPDQDTRLSTNTSTGKLAESVFETRIRLTELLHSPWHTEFVDKAKILSETMADVMNFLWSSEGILGSMPKLTADSVSKEELCWKIPIDVRGDGCHRIESISMSLTRKQLADEKWKPWEAYVTRVEAVLQLWMLQLSKYTKGEGNVLWVLCPDDDYKATMIADWWIGRDVGSVSDKTLETICQEYSISTIAEPHEGSPKYIIGCIGSNLYTSVPAYTQNVTRAFVQHMELGNFAAQYIFYTFLAHLVQSIDEVTTPTVVRDEEAAGPLLRNDTIMDVALKVEERGLFTVAEAYRMVLCAFAQNGKLPVPYHQSSHPFLVLYQKALKLGHKYKGEDDKSSPAALRAEKIYDEALRLCRFEALELINHKKWGDAGALLVRAARISEVFSTKGGEHLKEIKDLMHVVGSKCLSTAASVDAKADTFPHPPTSSRPELISPPSKLITAVLSQDVNKVQKLLLEAVNDNSTDSSMDNARALDHAAQLGNKEILILLHLYGALSQRAPLSAELSCTPLWWAVDGTRSRSKVPSGEYSRVIETDCDVEILELLLGFGHDPNRLEPKEGESPLHLAAKLNLMKAMRTLLAKVEPPSTHRIASINLKDKNGLSSLYYATKAGHGEMAKLLLTHGANVEGEIGPQNRSPVHYAARHGDHVVLKILHEKGGDIGAFDNDGRSPIYYAAKDGGKKVLDMLLEMGADINQKCLQSKGGRTALHWMALEGNVAAIRTLLKKEACLDEDDSAGKTALHHAVKERKREAVYVLLEHGAALDKRDTTGKIPLVYAKNLPHGGVEEDIIWLLDHGSDMKLDEQKQTALHRAASKIPADELAIEILLRCEADVEVKDASGTTALHLAAINGHERIVQILLDKKVEANVQDDGGWTPLHQAANKGHERIVQMLLDKKADISIRDVKGRTSLHYASTKGYERIVQILLDREAEVRVQDSKGWTPLHQATNKGYERIVEMLLDKGASVNVKHNGEWTPLHLAAHNGHERIVRMLLDKEAEVSIGDEAGKTALHHAVMEGQRAAVYILLEKGAVLDKQDMAGKTPLVYAKNLPHGDVEKDIIWLLDRESDIKLDDQRQTALHRAASKIPGDELAVETLLRCGADVEAKDASGITALHLAAINGHERIVQMLLDKKVEANVQDHRGWTPLHQAANEGHERIVQILLDKGASINIKHNSEWTPLHLAAHNGYERIVRILLDKEAEVNIGDEAGKTALYHAIMKGQRASVYTLLEKGAALDNQDMAGKTPLVYTKNLPYGDVEKDIIWLLDHESDMKLDKQRQTALHRAASKIPGDELAVEILLRCGADVEAKDASGITALHLAAINGHERIVQMLLDKNSEANIQDDRGWTPLHQAANEGHERIVQMLLDKKANIRIRDDTRRTSLHYASTKGHEQIVQILLDEEAEVSVKDGKGWTPLHQATDEGHERIVRMLLDKRASVNVKHNGEWTPLHLAAHNGHERIVRMLLDKEAEVNIGDEAGKTALHHAVMEGQRAAVYTLLEKGAALDKQDIAGKAPSVYAKNLPHGDIEKDIIWLLDHGSDMKLDEQKQTALHRASKILGDRLAVETLLRCGADVEAKDASGTTALHLAAINGHEWIVQVLLDKEVEANVQDDRGWTPLHQAANEGHERIVQMLLDKKADISIRDVKGRTSLHYASTKGYERIVQILLDREAEVRVQDSKGWTPLPIFHWEADHHREVDQNP